MHKFSFYSIVGMRPSGITRSLHPIATIRSSVFVGTCYNMSYILAYSVPYRVEFIVHRVNSMANMSDDRNSSKVVKIITHFIIVLLLAIKQRQKRP